MKPVSATAFLAVLTYPFVFGQPVPAKSDPVEQAVVVKMMNEVADAYVGRDPSPFERIFLEDYIGIRDKPEYDMRNRLIAMVRADAQTLKVGKRPDFQTLKYENVQIDVKLYENTAIVIAAKKNLWRYGDRKCLTSIQATELWIKRGGEWKAAAGHAANFHCDPKPYHPTHPALIGLPEASRPVNGDRVSEQELRELINSLVRAKSAGEASFATALSRSTTADFVFTRPDGSVVSDRNSLAEMPASAAARTRSSRNSDDIIVIFDAAAIYTFRLLDARGPDSTAELRRGTAFFVKTEGGWKVAALQISSH